MNRKKPFFLGVLVCIIFFVHVSIISLRDKSVTYEFRYNPTENIPLLLLGGLRGIAVDFLWARAIARHEEKKYYELLTINNLISRLQPNFPAVWIFQAWNMAYNIAHEWDAPQNKWKWIYAGLDFAKKGTLKNPKNGDLFFELGYMYFHLFDQRYFKYAAYYREQLKKENGEDNYVVSLSWLQRSLLHTHKLHNILAVERTICHVLWQASLCAEREGNVHKALEYAKSAIDGWEKYRINHSDDSFTNVSGFLSTLEKKKGFLESLVYQKRKEKDLN